MLKNRKETMKMFEYLRFKNERNEFTFSADDNDDAPESPILFLLRINDVLMQDEKGTHSISNWVIDEFTSSASDNEEAPEPLI